MRTMWKYDKASSQLTLPLIAAVAMLSANCAPGDDGIGSSNEALTGFTSQTDYQAATINGPTIDFNMSSGMVEEGNIFSPAVAFGSPESATPTKVIWNSNAITDTGSTTAENGVGPIGGEFTTPVSAFAFNYLSGSLLRVDLYGADGVKFAEIAQADQTHFFGVLSETPIKRFVAYGILFSTILMGTVVCIDADGVVLLTCRDRIFIDNFVIGQTAAEVVDAQCPCDGPTTGGTWKNHGQYVSCVAHAANTLLEAGEITEQEHGAIVSERAKSDCGKKAKP